MQAMFGAGCFWSAEDSIKKLNVVDVAVGYSGGRKAEPIYEQVCQGTTDHVEVALIDSEENFICYDELQTNFFSCHNPTRLNRQGPDVGTQYKSAINTISNQTANQSLQFKQKLNADSKFGQPIATIIAPASTFWWAEEYH